jgi:hypothetical protein
MAAILLVFKRKNHTSGAYTTQHAALYIIYAQTIHKMGGSDQLSKSLQLSKLDIVPIPPFLDSITLQLKSKVPIFHAGLSIYMYSITI